MEIEFNKLFEEFFPNILASFANPETAGEEQINVRIDGYVHERASKMSLHLNYIFTWVYAYMPISKAS